MELEQIKTEIRNLSKEDRRKLALFILELEKQYFQQNIGPQITEDAEAFSKVIQDAVEKVKKHVKDHW